MPNLVMNKVCAVDSKSKEKEVTPHERPTMKALVIGAGGVGRADCQYRIT
jgi:hypothetical protein